MISCCLNAQNKKIKIPEETNTSWSPQVGTENYELSYNSYLFNFNTNTTELLKPQTVEFSSFALKGLNMAYQEIFHTYSSTLYKNKICGYEIRGDIYQDYYVVCPVYSDKNTKILLDTQLAVTGTCYKGEDEILAIARELAEEIGITVKKDKLIKITTFIGYKRTETTYITDVSSASAFNSKVDMISSGTDDKSRKVQAVVMGKLGDLIRLYSSVYDRPPSDDIQTIRHIRFISLKEFI
jgi:8-oxo-dGTP pyrophosphatase MutT (NUDIX family)